MSTLTMSMHMMFCYSHLSCYQKVKLLNQLLSDWFHSENMESEFVSVQNNRDWERTKTCIHIYKCEDSGSISSI